MKKFLTLLSILLLLVAVVGCSDDDDNPVTPDDGVENTGTSTWNEAGGYWSSTVDGSSYDAFMPFSFASADTVSGIPKPAAGVWDIAFRREVVKTNGGSSTTNMGDAVATDLGVVDFAAVTLDDTTDVTWTEDFIDYFIDEWYMYNPVTHALDMTGYVYSMLDASGEHYVKFRIDSIVDAQQPPNMGTVHLTYFYQATADDRTLDGAVLEASVDVGSGTGYFDFSSGSQVTPTDPATSLEWDIAFYAYDLMQNSGPTGSGDCAAFLAFGELTDGTDIEEFTEQPAMAPLFPDIAGSALTEWYDYNSQTHQLTSQSHVYLVRTEDTYYKLRIDSYYANIGGVPASGHYTFVWVELTD